VILNYNISKRDLLLSKYNTLNRERTFLKAD
jgi:hypothetical protein